MSIFDFAAGTGPAMAETTAVCSRKACRAEAAWQLLWNNPKIHHPERRKIWLACGSHRGWLEDYLQTRGLWKETLPLQAGAGTGPLEQDS
jgi:hypothetical protein